MVMLDMQSLISLQSLINKKPGEDKDADAHPSFQDTMKMIVRPSFWAF
jgi:hypothetical protein